jgi:sulfate permease, SulP family
MNRSSPSRLAEFVPAIGWLRGDQPSWLRGDVVAGMTLAAYLISAAVLYACLFSSLVFWIFSSSRHTAVTVTSATIASILQKISETSP